VEGNGNFLEISIRVWKSAISTQRALRGALCTSAPKIGAHSTSLLLSSQFWPIPSMSRGVINSVKQRLSHPLSRTKLIDQWAVDPDPFLTLTTSAKIGKTAILGALYVGAHDAQMTP